MNMEERLRAAMRAEANNVVTDDEGTLSTIRSRGRSARNRRRAMLGAGLSVLVLVAALAIVPRLGDDDQSVVADDPTTTDGGVTTTTEATTTTLIPDTSWVDQVLWPEPGDVTTDPVEAARGFVVDYLGFPEPPLSEFREGEPGAGEIDVYATGENGQALDKVASTLSLREFTGGWYVTSAQSEEVVIDTPEPLAVVTSPVLIEGRGRGFEGTIVFEIREAFATEQLVGEITTAGCCEELVPFTVQVPLFGIEPARPTGALVAMNTSGLEEAITSFTAIPIRFEARVDSTVQVFFHRDDELVSIARPATSAGVLREALQYLLTGPTAGERADGFTSLFDEHQLFLDDVRITDGVATVSLGAGIADQIEASSSAAATSVVEQLNATVFQFPTVESVRYELGGGCEDFGEWVQPYGTCEFQRP